MNARKDRINENRINEICKVHPTHQRVPHEIYQKLVSEAYYRVFIALRNESGQPCAKTRAEIIESAKFWRSNIADDTQYIHSINAMIDEMVEVGILFKDDIDGEIVFHAAKAVTPI